jgi:RHS repeat-associated protein
MGTGKHVVGVAELIDLRSMNVRTAVTGLSMRAHHTATLLTEGRILVAGGVGDDGNPATAAEVWDPRSGRAIVLSAQLSIGRRDNQAALLADGTVLIWGGTDSERNPLTFGEVYDPEVQRFSLTSTGEGPIADFNAPFTEASLPPDVAENVPLDSLVAIRFSKPLRPETVTPKTVRLRANSQTVAALIIPAEGGRLAFVTPLTQLTAGTTYTLTLDGPEDGQNLKLLYKAITFTTVRSSKIKAEPPGVSAAVSAKGTPSDSLAPLQAPPGVTAVSGQARTLNGAPIKNVTLKIGDKKVRTDDSGRFLIAHIKAGHSPMVIDGRTASLPGHTYGVFEVGVDIIDGHTNVLPYTIWMTELDTAHAVHIQFPTVREVVVTTPTLPGLEFRIPANTVITDIDGKIASEISITPIPIVRPPFPLPVGVVVPIYFTIQPGGGYIQVLSKDGPKGARLIYPNSFHNPPGTRFDFWNYNADRVGWFVYGHGSVSEDAQHIVPDPGAVIYELTGAMVGVPGWFPSWAPFGDDGGGGGLPVADPVDLGTGLFVYKQTDLYLPDTIPIALTRVYRQGDNSSRAFGIGTTHPYDIAIAGDLNNFSYVELVLPDGEQIRFDRTSGNIWSNSALQCVTSPGRFFGATFTNQQNWTITLRDGTVYRFLQPGLSGAFKYQDAALYAISDRNGNTLKVVRDSNNYITQIVSPNGRWISLTYDASHRIIQAQDNMGRTVQYSYYPTTGQLQQVTDANNGLWTYTYDPVATDRMTTITDPRMIAFLTNQYDSNGRIQRQTRLDGSFYQFNYTLDADNNVVQTDLTDPNGNIRRVTFNPPPIYSNSNGTFRAGGTPSTEIRALGKTEQETFTYQRQPGSNLLLSVTDSLNRKTTYTYDSLGNIQSTTRLTGTSNQVTTNFTYEPTFSHLTSITDPLSHASSFAYDANGNLTSVTDPLGTVRSFAYNSAGQPTSATDPLGNSWLFGYTGGVLSVITDPMGDTVSLLTDGGGRVITLTDPMGRTTRYQYDNLNHLSQITDARGGITAYQYDPYGNLQKVTDPRNNLTPTIYQYNSMDRLQTRTDPLNKAESYAYDNNGNLKCHTDRQGNITVFNYDALNRRIFAGFGATSCTTSTFANSITYKYDAGDRFTSVVDTLSGTITPVFDGLDRLKSETTPQGSVSYVYDNANRRQTTTVAGQPAITYTFDNANRLRNISQGTSNVTLDYDSSNRRTSLTLPDGIVATYGYDNASRPTSITYQHGSSALGNLTYAYDQNGRSMQVSGNYARTGLPTAVSSATYDVANRITKWGTTTISYDSNGNLQNDGTNTYSWDARNHLSSITGGTTASFLYDAYGRRVSKTIGGTSTSLLYDVGNVIQELAGTTPSANLLAGGIDETFTRTDSSGTGNFMRDALSSTIALANSAGTVQTTYTYEPFGNTTSAGTSSGNPLQFTGRENDGTRLYFYRARYYSPGFQRFISEDPIGFNGASTNLYAYVGNGPTRLTDALGLSSGPDPRNPTPRDPTPGPYNPPTPNPLPDNNPPPPCPPHDPNNPFLPSNNKGINVSMSLPGATLGYGLDTVNQTFYINGALFGLTSSIGAGIGGPGSATGSYGPSTEDSSGTLGLGGGPLFGNDFWAPGGSWYPYKPFSIPFPLWPLPPPCS